MKTEKVLLSKLVSPERNVRIHPKEQIDHLARSIKMFGQFRNIVIDEKNVILAGNGLFAAMQAADQTHAVCYRITGLSAKQKKKLMLVDNKTFSLGMDLSSVQFEFIKEINDLDIPGFDADVISVLLANSSQITDKISQFGNMSTPEVEKRQATEQPNVGGSALPDDSSGSRIRCPHCGKEIWMPWPQEQS